MAGARTVLLLVTLGCSPKREPPAGDAGAIASEASVRDARRAVDAAVDAAPTPPPPPPSAAEWRRDACNDGRIAKSDTERALLWSCFGFAIDVPAGVEAVRVEGDLEGIVVDIIDPDRRDRLNGLIIASRMEGPVAETLRTGNLDTLQISMSGDFVDLPPAGAARRTRRSLQRRYALTGEDRIVAVHEVRVLDDELHQVRFTFWSFELSSQALEAAAAPLLRLRAMTRDEHDVARRHALEAGPDDWSPVLANRLVPISTGTGGPASHAIAFCRDGSFRVMDPAGAREAELEGLPVRGRWRTSHATLWIGGAGLWSADGLMQSTDGFELGRFGTTVGTGPFAAAGPRCRR